MVQFIQNYLNSRGFNQAQKAANDLLEQRQAEIYAQVTDFMRQGYTFLAELGETIRNSPIIYEVTLNANSESLVRTGYFSLTELMDYTYIEMHRGTFNLRLDNTKINKSGKFFQWSDRAKAAYSGVRKLAQNSQDLSSMNTGQLIEAFRDAADLIFNKGLEQDLGENPNQLLMKDPHGIHGYLHSAYTDRTKYYQAGDIVADFDSMFKVFEEQDQAAVQEQVENLIDMNNFNGNIEVQEKGQGATFTSFGGLLSSIKKAKNALEKLFNVKNKVASKTQNVQGFDAAVLKAARNLVNQFLPGAT